MTAREGFREAVRFGRPARLPRFDEGAQEDTVAEWEKQGLPKGTDLAREFGYDPREDLPVDIGPRPWFEGVPGDRNDLGEFRKRLDPDDPGRFPAGWDAKCAAWKERGHVLQFTVSRGFFLTMGVGDWAGFDRLVDLITDDPGLVGEWMGAVGDFTARLVARVLPSVVPDMAVFSEAIASTSGPLVSPRMYSRFAMPSYRPVIRALRDGGVPAVALVTWSNARPLLKPLVDAGINCLVANEDNSGAMDYRSIRREFGRDLALIGGVDVDAILSGERAVTAEFEGKVRPLLAEGGFIPLADGRIRANCPLANYSFYRRSLLALDAA
jgi:uroporphyrinogen decarboxylase